MSNAGRVFPPEARTFADPETGVRVRQLTDSLCHSNHLYFTNPGWWDGGRRLLFMSDRGEGRNLYSLELATGAITQLTDQEGRESLLNTSVNPAKPECYYWLGPELFALDLATFKARAIYRAPDGYLTGMTNVTSDGTSVCTFVWQAPDFPTDLGNGYVGFAEVFESRPHCQVLDVPVNGGAARVLHEEKCWIGHVNASPTQAHLLTFCHEGPWNRVDCRIWGLDRSTGKVWKIRPTEPGETVGHEYWLADGKTLGYHGKTNRHQGKEIFGFVSHDNTSCVEGLFPFHSTHFHSNTRDLIVGDGSRENAYVYLWQFRDGVFSAPRRLCKHRGSFHVQHLHVHPRFSPDGKSVLYTADPTGYGNVFLAEVPPFEDLKEAPAPKK